MAISQFASLVSTLSRLVIGDGVSRIDSDVCQFWDVCDEKEKATLRSMISGSDELFPLIGRGLVIATRVP